MATFTPFSRGGCGAISPSRLPQPLRRWRTQSRAAELLLGRGHPGLRRKPKGGIGRGPAVGIAVHDLIARADNAQLMPIA